MIVCLVIPYKINNVIYRIFFLLFFKINNLLLYLCYLFSNIKKIYCFEKQLYIVYFVKVIISFYYHFRNIW